MTTRKLHMADDLTLPLDAVTQTFAVLGKRGSGKTTTATVLTEELLESGQPVVVIDPLDVTWGLRSSRDGKKPGYPITVLGGDHADLPLEASAGAVLAEFVVESHAPIILSLRHFSLSDQRRFVTDFAERLYVLKGKQTNRAALHLVIDEVDEFAHQRIPAGHERLFGAIDRLVRRGRSAGIGVTMISQRPAVIHKDILSQAEVLVCHQTISPQDRKALETWIEAHDAHGQRAEFMNTLAGLQRGEAWVWSPGWLDVFRRVTIRDRRTFDSSSTPKAGEQPAAPKQLATVDLAQLETRMAATIEKAKADDPRELRRQISELRQQVAQAAAQLHAKSDPICQLALADEDRELLARVIETGRLLSMNVPHDIEDIKRHFASELQRFTDDLLQELGDRRDEFIQELKQTRFAELVDRLPPITPTATTTTTHPRSPLAGRVAPALAQATSSRPARQVSPADLDDSQRRIVNVVAMLVRSRGIVPTRETVARWLDIHPNGGRYGSNLAHLRQAGYLDGFILTEKGWTAAIELPSGIEAAKTPLDGSQARIIDTLVAHPRERFTRESLAKALGIHPNGGRYGSDLARLRTMGLIPERGDIYLTEGAIR